METTKQFRSFLSFYMGERMRILEDNNSTRIIKAAHDLFNARGYRSVTVQDLASELGMSKKTIYQYFEGKEEIAAVVVEDSIKKITEIMQKLELNQADPLTAFKAAFIHVEDEYLRIGPLFLADIQKYLPDLADKYKQFRKEGKQIIENLLKKAQEMGLVKDIPISLVMEILHESLSALVKPEFLSHHRFSKADVIATFLDIFMYGITNI